jgi:integrase
VQVTQHFTQHAEFEWKKGLMARARKNPHPGVYFVKLRNGTDAMQWIDPDADGRKRQTLAFSKLGVANRAQALQFAIAKSREIAGFKTRADVVGRRQDVATAWDAIIEDYREYFASEHGEAAGTRTVRDWLRRFRAFLARRAIRTGGAITIRHLTDFKISLSKPQPDGKVYAARTRNRHLDATKALLRWGVRRGCHRLPMEEVLEALAPFKAPRTLPRVLDRADLVRLIRACVENDTARCHASRDAKGHYYSGKQAENAPMRYEPLAPYVFMLLLSGCRPGEALALKWSDVKLQHGEIRIWGSKTERERAVPLHDSPALAGLLRALKVRSGGSVHVLGDAADGGPREIRRSSWIRLMEMAGLEGCPPKALRSTTVAHVASASTDSEYLLEARFGHGAEVSKSHYRKPLHGLSERGETVEQWLGIAEELRQAISELGLGVTSTEDAEARTG